MILTLISDPDGKHCNRKRVTDDELRTHFLIELTDLQKRIEDCDWPEIELVSGRISRWAKRRRVAGIKKGVAP